MGANGARVKAKSVFGVAVACAVIVLLACPALLAQPAGDVSSLSSQAASVRSEINDLDHQLEVATEAYVGLQVSLKAINAKVDDSERRLYAVNHTLEKRRAALDQRVAAMYEEGRVTLFDVLLDARSIGDLLDQADLLSRITHSDADLVKETTAARDSAQSLALQLSEQKRSQVLLTEQAETKRAQIQQQLDQRQAVLNGLDQQIQQMVTQQQQADIASEQVLNQQGRDALADAPGTLPYNLARTALKFLGVPYVWAAAGPNSFDCSGLTMYVYGMFGIDLPHNAAAQFDLGTKITLDKALPGDLVFFGMPPHHVAMYLGDDLIVEAPHTGDFVKVSKLSGKSDFSGVCRFWK